MYRSIRKYQAMKAIQNNEEGASAVEYGLLVAAIAAVIVLVIFALGGVIRNVFQSTCNSVKGGVTSSGTTISSTCS